MDLAEEYRLSQYEERGPLNGNERVRLVRNSITGKIAVKKCMDIGQKPVYDFLKNHCSRYTPEIYECVENAQQLIVIEQYIEGQNLEDFLSEGRITEKESCGIICSLCRALEPLHTADPPVACRDLKPENIMVTPQNSVMLIDFDIARMVSPGRQRDTVVMGTEGFAAPEQFGRRQSDARSDIYALGTILNYCILQKFPVEKIVDGKLGDIVRRCIAVNPEERYQSVAELRYEIKNISPSYRGCMEVKKFRDWKIPFTEKSFIISYDGTVKAGIKDLTKAQVTQSGNTIPFWILFRERLTVQS